jgi:hypothetical protein
MSCSNRLTVLKDMMVLLGIAGDPPVARHMAQSAATKPRHTAPLAISTTRQGIFSMLVRDRHKRTGLIPQ